MKVMVVVLQASFVYGSAEATWIDRKAEGWAWYENKVEQKARIERSQEIKTAQMQISEAKMLLEMKLAEAMIDPTEQNVMEYMVEQKKWLHQSASFARVWGKVLLQNPELDHTTSSPVTQYGIQLKNEIENENIQLLIGNLAKEHGLFFFYEGKCKISQGLAKVVQLFANKYSWNVVAVSIDGTILPEFQNSRLDNGISKQMGISVLPALFIVNPTEKVATPVAYGFVSVDQIEERIMLQFNPENEAKHD